MVTMVLEFSWLLQNQQKGSLYGIWPYHPQFGDFAENKGNYLAS